ncbi:MAG: hypothetical protein OQK82_05085 [Candidatus Pacearchaeota archaeon]|nr:hypothetical protein [Candidatus Pacearchaeota archaeon]
MNYSEWQLSRIRNAIRAYQRYERSHDGTYFNWKDVQEAIEEYTGEKVPHERLRQFVQGFKDKDGIRKFPAPRDAKLTAIVQFCTHEDVDLLNEDELEEFLPAHQAPLRLLEYLDQDFDAERIPPPDSLYGEYRIESENIVDAFNYSLTLERGDNSGLIQVTLTEEYFDRSYAVPFDEVGSEYRSATPASFEKYGGWAVLTPEDNLFIFLKRERNGMNLYYLTIASGNNIWVDDVVEELMMLRHDFPFEFKVERGARVDKLDPLYKQLNEQMMFFYRVEHENN